MYKEIVHSLECTGFEKVKVGKLIKASKIMYHWMFVYKYKAHDIKLYISLFSHNKELTVDHYIVLERSKIKEQFVFSFNVNELKLTLIQIGSEYELRINSIPFINLLSVNRNKINYDSVMIHPTVVYNTTIVNQNKPKCKMFNFSIGKKKKDNYFLYNDKENKQINNQSDLNDRLL